MARKRFCGEDQNCRVSVLTEAGGDEGQSVYAYAFALGPFNQVCW